MISAGFLNATGDPGSGIKYRFDDCSQTVSRCFLSHHLIIKVSMRQAFVYNSTSEVMISFDDPQSLGQSTAPVRFMHSK